jgi:hypothetical protein
MAKGKGTSDDPWALQTPSGQSEFEMHRDPDADPPALVCRVGKTELRYHLRAIDDLHAMLKANGDWVPLGNADEQKPAKEGNARPTTPSAGVRAEEGSARSLRELRASRSRGPRPGRGRASASEQSDAREVTASR